MGDPIFPLPWADNEGMSFLLPPAKTVTILKEIGFVNINLIETSDKYIEGYEKLIQKQPKSEKPTSGLVSKFDNFDFTKEESEAGYKNFCVIKCNIKSIEWLYLAARGHRRAKFDFENKKESWLVP